MLKTSEGFEAVVSNIDRLRGDLQVLHQFDRIGFRLFGRSESGHRHPDDSGRRPAHLSAHFDSYQ